MSQLEKNTFSTGSSFTAQIVSFIGNILIKKKRYTHQPVCFNYIENRRPTTSLRRKFYRSNTSSVVRGRNF